MYIQYYKLIYNAKHVKTRCVQWNTDVSGWQHQGLKVKGDGRGKSLTLTEKSYHKKYTREI